MYALPMLLRRLAAPLLAASLLILLAACAPSATYKGPSATTNASQTPALTHSQELDATWKAKGYMVAESGNVYIKYSDHSTFICEHYKCTQVELHVENGCPTNLYVEANIIAGGTVVGYTNASPGAVSANSEVKLLLEDIRGTGDTFKLSKVDCL